MTAILVLAALLSFFGAIFYGVGRLALRFARWLDRYEFGDCNSN